MNFSDIKSKSREQLKGYWLMTAGVMLIMFLITFALGYTLNGILSQILIIPITASVIALLFRVANDEGLDFSRLILTKSEYIRFFIFKILIFAIQFLIGIVAISVVTGGLMFSLVIEGQGNVFEGVYQSMTTTGAIVALLLYIGLMALCIYIDLIFTMTPYIIFRKNEDIDAISAMKYSRELVKGYKWNLLLFELSFIGWAILSVLTLGIGLLFLAPYYEVSLANYYLELVKIKEDYAREKGIIDRENETLYRTFLGDSTGSDVADEDSTSEEVKDTDSSKPLESKENDVEESPMDILTVEKLTTIEGEEENKINKDEK